MTMKQHLTLKAELLRNPNVKKEYDQMSGTLLELMSNALAELVYEATHLSPQEEDGSHRCRIHAKPLMRARSALRAYDNLMKNAPETRLDSKDHGEKDA